MNTFEQQSLIREEQLTKPLIEVLEEVTPKPTTYTPKPEQISKTLENSLDELFPEQQRTEKTIQRAKTTLGETAKGLSDGQLKDIAVEIEYLVDSWLDDFEREIFGGQTLRELLHEKGSL